MQSLIKFNNFLLLCAGHYQAYVKRNGSWWLVNDEQVTKKDFEDVVSECAENNYLLVLSSSQQQLEC